MGKLYHLPYDITAAVLTTYIYGSALYIAQFNGRQCAHYHYVLEQAEACHRRMERSARSLQRAAR